MLWIAVAVLFIAHALMHWAFKPKERGLLSGVLPEGIRLLPSSLWLIPLVGFLLAGLGVLGIVVPTELWQPLAIGSAAVSFAMLAIWHPWPWIGAALDAGIVAAALWVR